MQPTPFKLNRTRVTRGLIMKLELYQVDAFTDRVFGGNPAAICPLTDWLSTDLMQSIAMENCVAETAFFVGCDGQYEIRWFTPEFEMDLCGHATLAAAHIIWSWIEPATTSITFRSKSGDLLVRQSSDYIVLNFPARTPEPSKLPPTLTGLFDRQPRQVLKSRDYILVYESQSDIAQLNPDRAVLDSINLDPGGIVITAPGDDVDFVSRFFTPQASILEDPVTGSAHCSLIPYWSAQLNKKSLTAIQLSTRGGALRCTDLGDRIEIAGQAVTYLSGHIYV